MIFNKEWVREEIEERNGLWLLTLTYYLDDKWWVGVLSRQFTSRDELELERHTMNEQLRGAIEAHQLDV
jgi:hypothetical protein